MSRAVAGACIAMLLCAPAGAGAADEIEVYESLADVHIGRVFLSPAQRAALDERRGKPSPPVAGGSSTSRSKPVDSPDAAGYIISSTGSMKVWSRGNFVVSDVPEDMRFPGDVNVRRVSENSDRDDEPAGARQGDGDDDR